MATSPANKRKAAPAAPKTSPLPMPVPPAPPPVPPPPRDLSKIGDLLDLVKEASDDEIKRAVASHLDDIAKKYDLSNYHILYLYDDSSISSRHSNAIYEAAASQVSNPRDILLVVQSGGGRIEPAYLISKTCKSLSAKKFAVVVPRRAKSAATLLALGADEIHMGLMSELGPIDPQINGYPALGLTNALNKVAELSAKFPGSSAMWAQYLGNKLDLNDLGYFDRISESAAQYAERLMRGKKLPEGKDYSMLANHFVNHYKDHGFVIDHDEALGLLGPEVIKNSTKEYNFGNEVYGFLDFFEAILGYFKKYSFSLVGAAASIQIRANEKS
ncbi:hypothetical protein MRBLMS1_001994 [Massilia sp. LMS1-1-1.1]